MYFLLIARLLFTSLLYQLCNLLFSYIQNVYSFFEVALTCPSINDFGLIYSSVSKPRIQCVPEAFIFLNFFQLNGIQNYFGCILDVVFSNDKKIYIEKAVTPSVPCDPYHPALEIMVKVDIVSPFLDRSHNYFYFHSPPYITCYLYRFF